MFEDFLFYFMVFMIVLTFVAGYIKYRSKNESRLSILSRFTAATSVTFSSFAGVAAILPDLEKILELDFSIRSALPITTIAIALLCIMVAVYYTPRQLRIAAGATLGFLCAAYAYDGYVYLKGVIEDMAVHENEN